VVSAISVALALVSWKDVARLVRTRSVRHALAGFGFLLVWTALLMAMIRNYSGGLWFADWLEHFQRTLFFLKHFPADTPIFPGYAVPARPPMMNVLAAFFLAQTSDRFEIFQAAFAFFNLLLFLPCYLMMPALGKRARRRTWLLVLIFACSPLLMQNITYSWTKAAAAFFVVLALWFYLAGWRKRDPVRTTAAFISLAAGLLAHYSAGPYVVILTSHYLLTVFPTRPNKWRELAGITAICGLLVGTWLIWSLAVYGGHFTFLSNSTVTSSQEYEGSTVEKVTLNLIDTIIPVAVCDPALLDRFSGQRTSGRIRDDLFVLYQVNAIFSMGLVGGPLILWLAYRAIRRKRPPAPAPPAAKGKRVGKASVRTVPGGMGAEQRFWAILITAGLILGVAVVGERDPLGVGHLTLLSLQTLGLTMLAATIPWRRRSLAILVLAGCAIDFSAGVLLQARVESLDNSPQAIVFPGMEYSGGQIQTSAPGPYALSHSSWNNWFVKHQLAAYYWWYRALNEQWGADPKFQAMLPQFEKTVNQARADDSSLWQGWFQRHSGEIAFLGDHVAGGSGMGTNVAMALLCVLFLGLAGGVYWRTT
jgi:hypothetical protein